MKRYCEKYIFEDLKRKMVFIGGPRQVGKTTMSKRLCVKPFNDFEYFNWDKDEDRKAIRASKWRADSSLVIFDELHKKTRWKQWIKGVYDTKPEGQQYLITGSARLDVYKRGGDSLMGRYHYWRLHPLTLDELPPKITKKEAYRRLLTIGGFPEPFLLNDEREARRWRRERFERTIKEDLRDLEQIRHLDLISLLVDLLRTRVGGTVVISNLAEDLQVSHHTVKHWLKLVEHMYITFSVKPYTRKLPRAIQKPPKIYFYDNADTEDSPAMRLENLVATHLLKRLQFIEDYEGRRCALHYLRDKEGREVDFVTVIDGEIQDLIEVKLTNDSISKNLVYYKDKLKPKRAVQMIGELDHPYDKDGIRVTTPIEFFVDAPWEL